MKEFISNFVSTLTKKDIVEPSHGSDEKNAIIQKEWMKQWTESFDSKKQGPESKNDAQ